ncbi:MAG: type IV pilin, partial [Methanocella sp.]
VGQESELETTFAGEDEALPPKSPLLAAVASFFIPGLGQLYIGEKFTRALLFSIGYIIGLILLIIPGLLVWLYGIYDAYTRAQKINAGMLPNKKPNLLLMILLVPLVFIIMVVVVVLMAAVIAAFVFQLGGSSMPDNHFSATPTIIASQIDPVTVKITNMGGGDASLTGLRVMVNGTEISPKSGGLTPEDGSSGIYAVSMNIPVTVIADFGANTIVVYNMPV